MKQSKQAGDIAALVSEHVPAKVQVYVVEATPPEKCDLCGKLEECRPYGPNGENVCYDCGMLDKAAVERAIEKRFGF